MAADPFIDVLDVTLSSDEDYGTHTSYEQYNIEEKIQKLYLNWSKNGLDLPKLEKEKHIHYLLTGLKGLPEQMVALDASRCWIVYWILHSMSLLNVVDALPEYMIKSCILFLSSCQNVPSLNFNNFDAFKEEYAPNVEFGGYGGGILF